MGVTDTILNALKSLQKFYNASPTDVDPDMFDPNSMTGRRVNWQPGTRYWWESPDNARVERANVMQANNKFKDIELKK